jgi:hypothetical protein
LILFPLCSALTSLLIIATAVIFTMQKSQMDDSFQAHLESVQELTLDHLDNRSGTLSGFIELIKKDKALENAWVQQDRPAVLDHARRILKGILQKQQISHFYFITERRRWQEGVKLPKSKGDWDQFEDTFVISNTLPEIPPRIRQYEVGCQWRTPCGVFNTSLGRQRYRGGGCASDRRRKEKHRRHCRSQGPDQGAAALRSVTTILVAACGVGVLLSSMFYL